MRPLKLVVSRWTHRTRRVTIDSIARLKHWISEYQTVMLHANRLSVMCRQLLRKLNKQMMSGQLKMAKHKTEAVLPFSVTPRTDTEVQPPTVRPLRPVLTRRGTSTQCMLVTPRRVSIQCTPVTPRSDAGVLPPNVRPIIPSRHGTEVPQSTQFTPVASSIGTEVSQHSARPLHHVLGLRYPNPLNSRPLRHIMALK